MKEKNYCLFVTMIVIGLMSSDIYLPALPAMAEYFHVEPQDIQTTLSVYLLGLSISQIIYGFLSDRFGRRPVIIIGVAIYTIFSGLCIVSTSVKALVIYRFFQAVGACSGMVLGRTIVGTHSKKKKQHKFLQVSFQLSVCRQLYLLLLEGTLPLILIGRLAFFF